MSIELVWNYIVKRGIATNEELQLITTINGYTTKALNDVIYARTGYRNLEQIEFTEDGVKGE